MGTQQPESTKGDRKMKPRIAGTLAVALLGTFVLAAPRPAAAHGGGWGWGGFAAGAVTGVVLGGVFAPRVYAAPPVVYQPAPVYVEPAPTVVVQPGYNAPGATCSTYWVNGYWYGYNWVPAHWEQACR